MKPQGMFRIYPKTHVFEVQTKFGPVLPEFEPVAPGLARIWGQGWSPSRNSPRAAGLPPWLAEPLAGLKERLTGE